VSAVVPVVYNITQNQTSLASLQKELNNPTLHAVQQHLNRWNSTTLPVPGTVSSPFLSFSLENIEVIKVPLKETETMFAFELCCSIKKRTFTMMKKHRFIDRGHMKI